MTNENPRGLPVAWMTAQSPFGVKVQLATGERPEHATDLVLATDYAALLAELDALRADAARLDYIERTFSGMTNRERYLPVQMIWGKGCNGRTLREACDKYMARAAISAMEGR
jgi:hypothetical protein